MRVLTLNDEVHLGGLGLLVGEDGAHVGALVVHVHAKDLDAVLADRRVLHQHHARVQGPLLAARKQDGGAVQPGHPRHLAVHAASVTGGQHNEKEGGEEIQYANDTRRTQKRTHNEIVDPPRQDKTVGEIQCTHTQTQTHTDAHKHADPSGSPAFMDGNAFRLPYQLITSAGIVSRTRSLRCCCRPPLSLKLLFLNSR